MKDTIQSIIENVTPYTRTITDSNGSNIIDLLKDFVAPLIAFGSLGFAIYIHFKTQSMLRFFEKPIMSISKAIAQEALDNSSNRILNYSINILNIGKYPAIKFSSTTHIVDTQLVPDGVVSNVTRMITNKIDPNMEISVEGDFLLSRQGNDANPFYFVFDLSYCSYVRPKKKDNERLWFKYVGREKLEFLNEEEVNIINGFIKK